MEAILNHISMVPGVIVSCLCGHDGHVRARSFSVEFDPSFLQTNAAILTDIAAGLCGQNFGTQLVEHHTDVGRIIVKQIPEGFLAIFCSEKINVQLLAISLNVTQSSITKLLQKQQTQMTAPGPPPLTVTLEQPVPGQQASLRQLRRDGKGVILTIDSMKISAGLKWNQMEENIAISTALASEIQNLLKTGTFKKIKLSNKSAGCSRSFSVATFERDTGQLPDDRIVLTLAAAEALKAKPGDEITAEPSTGGLFGWG